MKTKIFLTVLFLCISVIQSRSQIIQRTYGGSQIEDGTSVKRTSDGGFIVGGITNSFGAGIYDFYLVRTDSVGDTLWTKTHGGIYNDYLRSVIQTYDGGFIATGESNSFTNNQDIYVVKTDANGSMAWSKTYGDTLSQSSESIIQTSDSGYAIIGTEGTIAPVGSWVLLIRTDSNGDTLWTKKYGWGIYNIGYSLQQTSDGGFIISASSYSTNPGNHYNAFIIKTDAVGDTMWTRYFTSLSGSAYGQSVLITSSGYMIGGTGSENFLAISLDANGNLNWQKEYDKGNLDRCFSMAQSGNDFLLAGTSSNFGVSDVLVIKIDNQGNELWARKFGGINREEGSSIQSLPGGGFVVCGNGLSSSTGSQDVYFIRSDCDNFPSVQISVQDTICIGDTIASTLVSSPLLNVTYQWLKDGSAIAGASFASSAASQTGLYVIIATDTNGCSNNSNEIFIDFPIPFFAINPQEACAGDIVKFGNWSFGGDPFPFYNWDLGDGTTDTGEYVSHVYADTGWYQITRTIVTSNGSCNPFVDSIHITTTAIPPVDFDMLVNSTNPLYNHACPGDRIEFIPYAYTYLFVRPPSFDATSYLWDFGDGTTDTTALPVHFYNQYGTFYVMLTVTNHCGNSASVGDSIMIDSTLMPAANFSWVDINGVSFDTLIACQPATFYGEGGSSFHWDFGDGTVIPNGVDSAVHAFAQAGTYSVWLIVTNSCGNTDSIQRIVYVNGTCTGISDSDAPSSVFVFPNPFDVNTTIHVNAKSGSNNFVLFVYDLQGKAIDQRAVVGPDIRFERKELTAGIYFFRLYEAVGNSYMGKFVVQ